MINLVFLGTSCMVPTKDRNHSALFLSYKSEGILIDCGEGTQRQLKHAGIKPTAITKILISHWHGDHTLGLPGLLQTLGASEYSKTLEIYGPKGSKERFGRMFDAFIFDHKIDMKIFEIENYTIFENHDFILEAIPLEHGIPCFGFRFVEKDKRRIKVSYVKKRGIPDGPLLGKLQENIAVSWKGEKILPEDATYTVKGKIISIIADTSLCNNCNTIAKNADLLVCESSYESKHEDKAKKYKHLTARQAALIASNANAKKLALTHFSQRYKSTEVLFDDAKTVFNNVVCAFDLMKIKI